MAIGSNSRVQFFGTRDSLDDGSTSAVSAGSYSVAGDMTAWTNDDDAEKAIIDVALTFGTSPTAGGVVKFYLRRINLGGVASYDEAVPDDDNQNCYVGSISVDNVTTQQEFAIEVDLLMTQTSQEYEFYLYNGTDQSLSSGWTADITPIAPGPHA